MATISRGRSSAIMLVLAIFLVSICCVCAESHTVGGSDKWALNVNYTDWAKGETFTVGDTLTFEWTGSHDVAEVNSSEYAACTSSGSVNGTSPVTHTLLSAKTYYYICTIDSHCTRGMKLAVPVSSNSSTSSPSSAPAPLITFFHVAPLLAPIIALFLSI